MTAPAKKSSRKRSFSSFKRRVLYYGIPSGFKHKKMTERDVPPVLVALLITCLALYAGYQLFGMLLG